MKTNNLELSTEEMRSLGYRVVDLLADHLSRLRDKPVGAKGDPKVLRPALLGAAPALGGSPFQGSRHVGPLRFIAGAIAYSEPDVSHNQVQTGMAS